MFKTRNAFHSKRFEITLFQSTYTIYRYMRISKQYSKVELSVEESGDEKKLSPNIAATAETGVYSFGLPTPATTGTLENIAPS
ncbi:hypothetical protein TNIN_465081 [Trichonephila inaurata madagascariensis]|uniref:Uncharacterized protein n=1 Tax=Trichonephila inaurata madagascariensis TaxID=2747483 RepID=A0A8X7CDL6_9ARAC|nr:hypothetical protein TNIN_465081 [Trichonephila inaurata madagascariensis]